MRTVSYRIGDLCRTTIHIGRVAENEYTRVQIDAGEIYAVYPHAAASLTVQPPAGDAYPALITRDGDLVIWDVPDSALTEEGTGEIQLTFAEDGVVIKSAIGQISVSRSIIGEGEAPDPLEDFLAEAGAALTAIPETIAAALEEAKESGEFDGQPGEDGVSPVVSITQITGGHRVTITDKEGVHTADVMDGAKGDPGTPGGKGDPGTPGHSPVLTSSKSGKVTTIYSDGVQLAQINDGQDGQGGDIIDDTAGAGDTDKTFSADKLTSDHNTIMSTITQSQTEENLLRSEMPGTATTVTMDSNGNPTSIVHTANSATVRTDTFVWGTGTVTETRTLANGKYITITTNLETLAQTISAVQEVA